MLQENKSTITQNPFWMSHGYGARFQSFQTLMRNRVRDILLVSSPYDLYIFEEDGHLYEQIRDRYEGLNLTNTPEITRVSSGQEAIRQLKEGKHYDLVITTLHIEDMHPTQFVEQLRDNSFEIPVVMLAFDNKELSDMIRHKKIDVFDEIFIWLGDPKLILAIIKSIEDKINVEHDTDVIGVQSIIVIEDNIRYYSSFLPLIYLEILKHTQRLISEGVNLSHKRMRMRARPKILLCKNYDEAREYFQKYQETILGVISDISFPRAGKLCQNAGLLFAREVHSSHPDIPILLNSKHADNETQASKIGASFLLKDSPTLLQDLREFMIDHLSFGDFIFRMPDGQEFGRASDLISLEKLISIIPGECLKLHGSKNHFSNWLKARTEFWLAHELRPRKISDFPSIEAMRKDLVKALHEYREIRQRGIISDFHKSTFDPDSSVSRIGGGSLGGKARGLSFVNILINNTGVDKNFPGIRIHVPSAVVIGTDVFDQFIEENQLRDFALSNADENEILDAFLKAKIFPNEIRKDLNDFLEMIDTPLAIRSSSLLEDSHNYPFAGVYKTYMLPNQDPNLQIRLSETIKAIKRVYASTFFNAAKDYFKATSYRLEEEKMAVIIQKLVGSTHNSRFYPTFSGVGKSFNFYPIPPQKYSDGVINLAIGMGKTVVEGGTCVRYCPKYPKHIDQFSSLENTLKHSQKAFYALNMNTQVGNKSEKEDYFLQEFTLDEAEEDNALNNVASTYSAENDQLYDGIRHQGNRVITFAPILKHHIFPINEILACLLEIGAKGMGTAVEVEFAVNLDDDKQEFGLLQIRPMVINRELDIPEIEGIEKAKLLCESQLTLGHGIQDDIYDIVMVDRDAFNRSKSQQVAEEVNQFNSILLSEERPYLLIGVGRWGSLDPWLGIPVTWSQISGARAIIESDFKDMNVTPSQGSHFFQNLNSFQVSYLTVRTNNSKSFLDWDWLNNQSALDAKTYTKLLRFKKPVIIKISGQQSKGIIIKPNS